MNNNIEVIGIDHGWSQMKTSNTCFNTSIKELANAPAFHDNVLEYDDRYFAVGEERLEVLDSKVENENFYLLTLVAIAKELEIRGKSEADVVLAVGLPLTRFSAERKPFIDYLSKNRDMVFGFEQKLYTIHILNVLVYPQCYAAVAGMLPTFGKKALVIDVGSWTVDSMLIVNKKPDNSKRDTQNEGLIKCMRAINRVAVQVKNRKIDEAEIQEYMKTGKTELPKDFKEIMDQQIQIFVDKVYRYQTECGYSLDMMPVYFVGGGAVVMRNFGRYQQSNIHYVLDEMKSVFYYMFKGKADALQILMFKYKYPNIQREEVEAFCNDLLFLLGSRREMKEEEKFLAGMLARAAESDELVFLHDNDDYVMQENYAEFYADPIRKYQKSRHIFDEETTVQDIVKKQIAMGENPGFLCSIGPWDGIGILNRFFEMVKSRKEK